MDAELEKLATAALDVLMAQKLYFKTRDRGDLIRSKRLENELRLQCEQILSKQEGLPLV